MVRSCRQCRCEFFIDQQDLDFYQKISPVFAGKKYEIPVPTLCPDCRCQRRISWRNERSLYHRQCSMTGKNIIAQYPPDTVFPVYDNDVWWGDKWDGREYGRDFDFSLPFFEQFIQLRDCVPHFALAVAKTTMENSDYCNHAGYLKDCYLIYNVDYDERCMYGKGMNRCFDCMDCFKIYDCEACYECMSSYNCKFSTYLWDSYNCSECNFSSNLIGCHKCFLCVNLQNQEYYIQNKKYSEQAWKEKVEEFRSKYSNEELLQMLIEMKEDYPVKVLHGNNTENCTGDYLTNCKNCKACYDCEYLENSAYCYDLKKGDGVSFENCDLSAFGLGVVQCYEGGTVGYNANHCLFVENVWSCFDVHYSMLCVNNCKNCFGCVGLKKAEYCVLNKQYGREEYEELVPKIIEHMKKTPSFGGSSGEWGEFFPSNLSPFAYNETMAHEYYPLTKEEVLGRGLKWKDGDQNKNFKIQKLESNFYRKMNLPVPKYGPDERHLRRLTFRNPRKLWDRRCVKCGVDILTTYSPDRKERVYCEECYLKEVF